MCEPQRNTPNIEELYETLIADLQVLIDFNDNNYSESAKKFKEILENDKKNHKNNINFTFSKTIETIREIIIPWLEIVGKINQ